MRLGMEFRYVARALFHFNADETRFENHLPGVNVFYVELCGHAFAVKEFKHFVWRTVSIDITDVGVGMGKGKVSLFLEIPQFFYGWRGTPTSSSDFSLAMRKSHLTLMIFAIMRSANTKREMTP